MRQGERCRAQPRLHEPLQTEVDLNAESARASLNHMETVESFRVLNNTYQIPWSSSHLSFQPQNPWSNKAPCTEVQRTHPQVAKKPGV